jgi:glucose-6-phosphate isomerase
VDCLAAIYLSELPFMSLLRFDASGSLDRGYGVTPAELGELAPSLLTLRQAIVETDELHAARSRTQDAEQSPFDFGFFRFPERTLADYECHRENSELGRIFQLANGIHDEIDAVVVLGIGGLYLGPRAIMEACCDPYHNELTRGARGSKPRMYFEGNRFDNDASASLLHRLAAGGYGDSPAEGRYAIVVIGNGAGALETAVAFGQHLAALERSLGAERRGERRRLVIPVTGESGRLRDLAEAIGCEQIFSMPEDNDGCFGVLSSVGLLPAALLGLDCIRFLEGAVAMNEHFRAVGFDENVVLQYVAINHWLASKRGKTIRVMHVCSKALESVGLWYAQLLARSINEHELGTTPLTLTNTEGLRRRQQRHQWGRNDKVFNNLIVECDRCDPLFMGDNDLNQGGLQNLAGKTITEVRNDVIRATNDALHEDGRPTTDIILPHIDTYYLGQLFQMLMIATAIEGRLLGIDPFRQPGREPYVGNMSENLGRVSY